ncbi:MAG: hypothetical protein ACREIQ_10945, partial [Nitrospiria bacterium]
MKGGTRNGEEIRRYIRGRTLQGDAPALRLMDEASTQEVPGKRAESCAEAGRRPAVGSGGTSLEWSGLEWT